MKNIILKLRYIVIYRVAHLCKKGALFSAMQGRDRDFVYTRKSSEKGVTKVILLL